MPGVNDEFNEIVKVLRDKLELMQASGLKDIMTARPALEDLRKEILSCKRCASLTDGKWPGEGREDAGIVFVAGSRLSDEEREQLTRIIKWMGSEMGLKNLEMKDVYLCYAINCPTPAAGTGSVDKAAIECAPFLKKEISAISPKVIITLGPVAAKSLLANADVKRLRGRFHDFKGIRLMPTYDPGEMLKKPELKKEVLVDMKMVIGELKKGAEAP